MVVTVLLFPWCLRPAFLMVPCGPTVTIPYALTTFATQPIAITFKSIAVGSEHMVLLSSDIDVVLEEHATEKRILGVWSVNTLLSSSRAYLPHEIVQSIFVLLMIDTRT